MMLSKEALDYARSAIDTRCNRLLSNLEEDLANLPRTHDIHKIGREANYLNCVSQMAIVIVDTYKEAYLMDGVDVPLQDVEEIGAEISRIGNEAISNFGSQEREVVDLIVQVAKEDLIIEIKKANLQRKTEGQRRMNEKLLIETERRRYQLLKTIFDKTQGSSFNYLSFEQLQKDEQLTQEQLHTLTEYLRNEGLVEYPTMGTITITHRGVKEIEASVREPNKATEHFTPTVIQNFHGNVYGVQTSGSHNTQNVQVNINPDFDQNIASLVELINKSSLGEVQKEETLVEIKRVSELAQKEKTPDVIEAATKRLNLIKLAFDVVTLTVQAAPHLQYLYQWFQS